MTPSIGATVGNPLVNIKVPSVSVANLPHKTPNGCPRTARDDEPANPSKNRDSVPCNAVVSWLPQLPNTFHLIGELDDSKLASNSISIPLFCIVAKFP
jgi:hypothetical protein